MTRTRSTPDADPATGLRDGSIDAGLHLLELTSRPGRSLTQQEIAFVCGCTASYITQIEGRAIQKLRRALKRRGLHKAP